MADDPIKAAIVAEGDTFDPDSEGAALKRQEMKDFAAAMEGSQYGEKAVEIVNALGIGDGAAAVSGTVMLGDFTPEDSTYYLIDIQLDNGKFIMVGLSVTDMRIYLYERFDTPMMEALYG